MSRRRQWSAAVVVVMAALLSASEAVCTRRYRASEPDCSCAKMSDGSPAEGHMPCLAVDETDGSLRQLEFPSNNSQTCYRTCIDSDQGQCQAALVSSVNNRDLAVGPDFKLWVFSQGFQRSVNQKYRKSSICRYNIQCGEGQLLSYSLDFLQLEEPATCGASHPACLDSLTLFLPGMGASLTSCGSEPSGPTISDGSSQLFLEFTSNREKELAGFLLLAWCVDPTLKTESSSREERSAGSGGQGAWSGGRCSSSGWGSGNGDKNESAALQKLADAFPPHSRKILAPSALHITVDVFGHVSYTNNTISITVRNGSTTEFPGITRFHLSNRILNESVFNSSAPGRYHGYGYIVMWKGQAFFLQDGVNPEFRPTEEEQKLIEEFQTAIREAAITEASEEGESGSGSGSAEPTVTTAREWQSTASTESQSPTSEGTQPSTEWTKSTSEQPTSEGTQQPTASTEREWGQFPGTEGTQEVPPTAERKRNNQSQLPEGRWRRERAQPEPPSSESSLPPATEDTQPPISEWSKELSTEWSEEPSTEWSKEPSTDWTTEWSEEPSTEWSEEPTSEGEWSQGPEPLLLAKAWAYSTACNALLRSMACAYLQLVAGQDCPSLPGLAD